MKELRWQCPACLAETRGDLATAEVMRAIGWQPIGNVTVDGNRLALCPRCVGDRTTVSVRRTAS